jgi:lipid II:glycine glycyltransferase (peptidoglycan interpeptide bridge formation enzyme)
MNPAGRQFELKELTGSEDFDLSGFYTETPFTQADFYADWQRSLGREVKKYIINNINETTKEPEIVAYFQMIKYPLLLGKSYFYIPYGPVFKNSNTKEDLLVFIKQEIKKISMAENAVFTRLDFTPVISNEILSKFFTQSPLYTYHSSFFQPRTEWFLNLEKSETELLADMHKNHRYSIRVAEKEKVNVEIVTENFEKYFETFYKLMAGTAERNNFKLHPKNYYKNIFQNLSKINAHLAIAKYNEKILVIDLVIIYGGVANYVFSGSSNEERDKMPTYLALWKSILQAKTLGCKYYNFGGITGKNEKHVEWEGITSFKKKFGGQEISHSDFFDLVANPFLYHLYNLRKLLKRFI